MFRRSFSGSNSVSPMGIPVCTEIVRLWFSGVNGVAVSRSPPRQRPTAVAGLRRGALDRIVPYAGGPLHTVVLTVADDETVRAISLRPSHQFDRYVRRQRGK